jgi:hypothetical protein
LPATKGFGSSCDCLVTTPDRDRQRTKRAYQ